MAVLVTAEVHGQTRQGYDGMLSVLGELARQAPGFIVHGAYEVDGVWKVVEIWASKEEANRFFAEHIAPNLPPGVRPKRSMHEMHSCIR